jgi:hypothetical protein
VPKVWGKAKPEWAQEIEAQVRIVDDRDIIAVKNLLRRWMWGLHPFTPKALPMIGGKG